MVALGSDRRSERAIFDANADACGEIRDGETWWCSRSCETLGRHFLVYPDPYETYEAVLARVRAEAPA